MSIGHGGGFVEMYLSCVEAPRERDQKRDDQRGTSETDGDSLCNTRAARGPKQKAAGSGQKYDNA